MTTIKRYNPYVQSFFGFTTARMGDSKDGGYVTYESHQQKVDALQSRIDALESMQKRKDFDAMFDDVLNKVVDESVRKIMDEIKDIQKPKFTIKTDGIQINTGTSAVKLGVLDEIPSGHTYINDAVISGEIKSGVGGWFLGDPVNAFKVKPSEPKKHPTAYPPALKCIKTETTSFTAGESYSYGYKVYGGESACFLSSDDFVSDLAEGERWELEDRGAYFATAQLTHDGKPFAIFKKP